jgi:hypothetical protein
LQVTSPPPSIKHLELSNEYLPDIESFPHNESLFSSLVNIILSSCCPSTISFSLVYYICNRAFFEVCHYLPYFFNLRPYCDCLICMKKEKNLSFSIFNFSQTHGFKIKRFLNSRRSTFSLEYYICNIDILNWKSISFITKRKKKMHVLPCFPFMLNTLHLCLKCLYFLSKTTVFLRDANEKKRQ